MNQTLEVLQLQCLENLSTELQKSAVLVYRIPDIFERKSEHFKIFTTNMLNFSLKQNDTALFYFNSTPNECD